MAVYVDGIEVAVSKLESNFDALHHQSHVFPGDTNKECTLTAAEAANTWSDYTEITDGTTTLTSLFATSPGHITVIQEESLSEIDTFYMLEITWGSAHTLVTEQRMAGGTKFQNPDYHARTYAPAIPAGETIYYRMKTATAVADTCTVHLRYHNH